ncbi:hypothetical protein DIZ27_39250 [Streptomyces sp. NWU339]|nr:hypothetical protein DIZ27_39250 [Streptomyces sp. NWU339]
MRTSAGCHRCSSHDLRGYHLNDQARSLKINRSDCGWTPPTGTAGACPRRCRRLEVRRPRALNSRAGDRSCPRPTSP